MSISFMTMLLLSHAVPAPLARTTPPQMPTKSAEPAQPTAPIRAFDTETLAGLGRAIYRHDQWAWVATDLLGENVGLAKFGVEGGCGWVVDEDGTTPFVRFLREGSSGIEAAYDVTFPKIGPPVLEVPRERRLTPAQQLRAKARISARRRIEEGKFLLCEVQGSYNAVVLDDPSGKGFLVYWLRPKETLDQVPVGGHYRISVAPDGTTVNQVDRLSASCITLDKSQKGKTSKDGYFFVSHLVSNTPLETHVFMALQEKLPMYVVMQDGKAWIATPDGRILYLGDLKDARNDSKSPK